MIRRLCFILALMSTMPIMSANNININDALAIASRYINNPTLITTSTAKQAAPAEENDKLWFFKGEGGKGFVIIANNDSPNPVLGYSHDGRLTLSNMPDALREYLANVSDSDYSNTVNPPAGKVVVEPLLHTKWNQLEPYNSQLPFSKPMYTGCPATAMAQLMNYYKWPKKGNGSYSYHLDYLGVDTILSRDFSQSEYDWDNMADTYTTTDGIPSWTPAQAKAVGTLMLDCGIAVNMLYDTKASGSFDNDVCEALNRYFGYDANYLNAATCGYDSIMNTVRHELDNGRPVLMSGCSNLYLSSGHFFLADGYDTEGFLHMNWGWSGDSDGFYNPGLFRLSNSPDSYHSGCLKIITARPSENTTGDKLFNYIMACNQNKDDMKVGLHVDSIIEGNTAQGGTVNIKLYNLISTVLREVDAYATAGIFDDNNNLVATTAQQPLHYDADSTASFQPQDINIPIDVNILATLPDGTYTLRPMTRRKGVDTFCLTAVYSSSSYTQLTISDGHYTIADKQTDSADVHITEISLPERLAMLSTNRLRMRIKNHSATPADMTISGTLKATNGTEYPLVNYTHIIVYGNTSSVFTLPFNVYENIPEGKYTLNLQIKNAKYDVPEMPVTEIYLDPQTSISYSITSVESDICTFSDNNITVMGDTINIPDIYDLLSVGTNIYISCSNEVPAKSLQIRGTASNPEFSGLDKKFSLKITNMAKFAYILFDSFDLAENGTTDVTLEYLNPLTKEWTAFDKHGKLHIATGTATDINTISNDNVHETMRHDISGRRVGNNAKGIVIIHRSDGSVVKTYAK